MGTYIQNIINTIMDFFYTHWVRFAIGIAISLLIIGGRYMLKWLICKSCIKPKIIIEYEHIRALKPVRWVWKLSIYNEKLTGLKRVNCKREEISCWFEAKFLIGATQSPRFVDWGYNPPNYVTLKPDSNRFEIELVSKLIAEKGFHIKEPSPEYLIIADYADARIVVKTRNEEIIKESKCKIFDKGDDLDCERLDC